MAEDFRLHADEGRTLTSYLLSKLGRKYSRSEAMLAATCCLKRLAWHSAEKPDGFFCDDYVGRALIHVRRLELTNTTWLTPATLIRRLIENGVYAEPVQIRD